MNISRMQKQHLTAQWTKQNWKWNWESSTLDAVAATAINGRVYVCVNPKSFLGWRRHINMGISRVLCMRLCVCISHCSSVAVVFQYRLTRLDAFASDVVQENKSIVAKYKKSSMEYTLVNRNIGLFWFVIFWSILYTYALHWFLFHWIFAVRYSVIQDSFESTRWIHNQIMVTK